MNVTVNFLPKPSYQYAVFTNRPIFFFLTIPLAFVSFSTLLGFVPRDLSLSRSLILYLQFLAQFSRSFLPHFLCVQKRFCLDLHPFFLLLFLSLFLPPSPLSLVLPLTFFTFPLTITHPNSPSFPLFPSTPIPLVFFSPSLFAELIWTFSWSIQCDPRAESTLWTVTEPGDWCLSCTSSFPPITRQQSLGHSRTFNFCLPVNPLAFPGCKISHVSSSVVLLFFPSSPSFLFLSVKPQSCARRSTGKIKATLFSFPSRRAAPSASSIREWDSWVSTGIFPGPALQECWTHIPLTHIRTHTVKTNTNTVACDCNMVRS